MHDLCSAVHDEGSLAAILSTFLTRQSVCTALFFACQMVIGNDVQEGQRRNDRDGSPGYAWCTMLVSPQLVFAILGAMKIYFEKISPPEKLILKRCQWCGYLSDDLRSVFCWTERKGWLVRSMHTLQDFYNFFSLQAVPSPDSRPTLGAGQLGARVPDVGHLCHLHVRRPHQEDGPAGH